MTDEELTNPGVQKLIIDELEQSDAKCSELEDYVERYYEADKRAAVLEEKVRTVTAIEICFGVGTAFGGVILGLAPFFWNLGPPYGQISLIVGLGLIIGGTVARVAKR
jgi:hypothetical protein